MKVLSVWHLINKLLQSGIQTGHKLQKIRFLLHQVEQEAVRVLMEVFGQKFHLIKLMKSIRYHSHHVRILTVAR